MCVCVCVCVCVCAREREREKKGTENGEENKWIKGEGFGSRLIESEIEMETD